MPEEALLPLRIEKKEYVVVESFPSKAYQLWKRVK
jgi:hypothetical protein